MKWDLKNHLRYNHSLYICDFIGKDIIGQAQTGTGKTAAFSIPLLEMINPEEKK